jgi:hypothetical protein
MIKSIFKSIVSTIFVGILLYLMGLAVCLEPNIFEWTKFARIMIVFPSIMLGIIVFIGETERKPK